MLWQFRREIIFIVGLFLAIMIARYPYVKRINNIETSPKEEINIINYQELIAENIRLREILDIKKDIPFLKTTAIGQVISIRPYVFPAEIIVNKGRENNIREGMTVLSRDISLIGRVVRVNRNSASIRTVFNKKSRISVIVDSTREIGILEGGSIPLLHLRYIPYDSQVQEGDKVLTSGFSDFYPKDIKVGEIIRIERNPNMLFLQIHVRPFSGISDLEEVIIGETKLTSSIR